MSFTMLATTTTRARNPNQLTCNEMAEYLGIHAASLRKLMLDGKIPGTRLGGKYIFFKDQVDAWLKDQAQANATQSPKALSSPYGRSRSSGRLTSTAKDIADLEKVLGRSIGTKRKSVPSVVPLTSKLKAVR